MAEMVLLGDEALAQAAIDAGLSAAYAYPGTPSSEIVEYLRRKAAEEAREYCMENPGKCKPAKNASWGRKG